MTLKTAQLIIIAQLFTRHAGRRQGCAVRSQVDWGAQVAPASVARQAWLQLKRQGLVDERGRLTLSGLALAVALRSRARRSAREVTAERKTETAEVVTAIGRLLLAA